MRFYDLGTLISDIKNNLAPLAGADNDDNDGAAIDLEAEGQYHSGVLLCFAGAATGGPSDQSVSFKIEQSEDNSVWTAVTDKDGNDMEVELTADNEVAMLSIRPNELNRYIRSNRVLDLTGGSSPAWPTGAIFLLGHGNEIPG